jgi:hypothetical protein
MSPAFMTKNQHLSFSTNLHDVSNYGSINLEYMSERVDWLDCLGNFLADRFVESLL